jgi:hypothetical protein
MTAYTSLNAARARRMQDGERCARHRPNKTAQGMTRTLYRSGHKVDGDALTLSVHGTLDALGRFRFHWKTARSQRACPCCGNVGTKRVLNDRGRVVLARYRRGVRYCKPHPFFLK